MGVLVQGVCLADVPSGQGRFWSSVGPVVSATDPPVVVVPAFRADVWVLDTYVGGVLSSTTAAPSPDWVACDLGQQAVDGATVGFAVVLVWVSAWAVNVLRRSF